MAGIGNDKLRLYGVQFHPEVDLTVNGRAMLKNFLFDIAGLTGNFTIQGRELECVNNIKETVGNNKVLVSDRDGSIRRIEHSFENSPLQLLLSGGVDSTVCAALLHKALRPEQVIAVHIDNGFMRKNESAVVGESLRKLGLELRIIKASHQFFEGMTFPPLR